MSSALNQNSASLSASDGERDQGGSVGLSLNPQLSTLNQFKPFENGRVFRCGCCGRASRAQRSNEVSAINAAWTGWNTLWLRVHWEHRPTAGKPQKQDGRQRTAE